MEFLELFSLKRRVYAQDYLYPSPLRVCVYCSKSLLIDFKIRIIVLSLVDYQPT
jgi:hypothetical protein